MVFLLAVLVAFALAVRLSVAPMAIDGIGDKIEAALQERFGKGLRFSLGQTSLVQRGLTPSVTIDKLEVTSPNGEPVVSAPRAEISIDPFALFVGKVVPRRLEVFGIALHLTVLANGHLAVAAETGAKPFFELGGEDPAAPEPAAPATTTAATPDAPPQRAIVVKRVAAAIREVMNVLTDPDSAIAAVDRLGISNGALVIDDEATHAQTTYTDLNLAFDRSHGQTSFDLSARGPSRRWGIDAIASGRPHAPRRFAVKAHDFSIDELSFALGSRSLGVDSDMPIGAHIEVGLNADDTLSEASGGFSLGAGFFRIDDPDQEPQFVTAIDGSARWNAAQRVVEIPSLGYVEGGTHLSGKGVLRPPRNEGDPWGIELASDTSGVFAPDRKGDEPVPVTAASFAGRLSLAQQRFSIDKLSLTTPSAGMAALGQVDWADGPHLRFGMSLGPAPVAVVKRLWPAFVAAPVRAWMLTHLEEGRILNGQLKVDYNENDLKRMRADRAPSDSSVQLDFDVTDGRVAFIDGVPPIQNVVGHAHVTGRSSRFAVSSGDIETNGRRIALEDGFFFVANSNIHPIEARIRAHLTSSVDAVADLLSLDALKPYGQVPLDPATLHGQVDGVLDKTIFLGAHDESRDNLKVDAHVTDLTAQRLIGKEDLTDAGVDIAVDAGKLKATGQGKIFGAPAAFEIDRVGFTPPTANVAITLDDAARAKLGLSAVQGITGPIVARLATTLGDPTKMKAQVELDLSKATVAAAYVGINKPAGRPGKIAFNLAGGGPKMVIDQINADIGPFQARGFVDLAPDNSFQGAHFSSVKVSPGDDMKLDVAKVDDVYRITIRGSNIDARPFLKAVTSTPVNEPTPVARSARAEKRDVDSLKGLDLDLKSAILTGFNKEALSGVELKLSKRGPNFRQFSVQGRFGQHVVSAQTTGVNRIKVSTEDAGSLVAFIDLYKHMERGNLAANLSLDSDNLSGNLEIHDFILRDEPALRRLVAQSTEVSAPGADADAARRINAGAVRFNRLKVNFERQGSQLELRDAAMSGPDIGLSIDGWLDYSHDRVDMKGTFVPAFALNNLFSQIPVFGVFLGGKSNEGLLAITFRITGLVSSPSLSINPLSAVAPGILRNIFGALDDAAFRGTQPRGSFDTPSR